MRSFNSASYESRKKPRKKLPLMRIVTKQMLQIIAINAKLLIVRVNIADVNKDIYTLQFSFIFRRAREHCPSRLLADQQRYWKYFTERRTHFPSRILRFQRRRGKKGKKRGGGEKEKKEPIDRIKRNEKIRCSQCFGTFFRWWRHILKLFVLMKTDHRLANSEIRPPTLAFVFPR